MGIILVSFFLKQKYTDAKVQNIYQSDKQTCNIIFTYTIIRINLLHGAKVMF